MSRSRIVPRCVLALLGTAAIAACVPPALTAEDPASEALVAESYSRVSCQAGAACCQKWFHALDAAACAELTYRAFSSFLEKGRKEGGTYVPAEAAGYLAILEDAVTRCEASRDAANRRGVAWERTFTGPKARGVACASSFECADPVVGWAVCGSHRDASSGTCMLVDACHTVRLGGVEGDPCHPEIGDPQNGELSVNSGCNGTTPFDVTLCDGTIDLFCDPQTNRCSRRRLAGEVCRYEVAECGADTHCSSMDSTTAVCAPDLPAGASCTDLYACETSGACVDGICVPPAEPGGPCGDDSFCPRDQSCLLDYCVPRYLPVHGDFCARSG
jgi:hypothetical protein